MSLRVNLRHLEEKVLDLEGDLTPEELEMERLDELIQVTQPIHYTLQAQKLGGGVLVQGELKAILDCECARCLKRFQHKLIMPEWAAHFALEGEDAVSIDNDCVDLTPQIREDMVLGFPQHPLCDPECAGLPVTGLNDTETVNPGHESATAWDVLDKLKLKK